MKNLILATMVIGSMGMGLATGSANTPSGQDRGSQLGMTWPWSHTLKEEVAHLNRMRGHVRWQLRNYRGNKEIRHDFYKVSHDIDEINSRIRSGSSGHANLRHDVERAHIDLHRIETALKVKPRDYYPWR